MLRVIRPFAVAAALTLVCPAAPLAVAQGGAVAATPVTPGTIVQTIPISLDGRAVDGRADLRFALFDARTGGSQIGPELTRSNALVINGLYNAQLNFGPGAFDGNQRFIRVQVRRPAGSTQPFRLSGSRRPVSISPYALFPLNEGTPGPQGPQGPQGPAGGAINGLQLGARKFSPSLNKPLLINPSGFVSPEAVGTPPPRGIDLDLRAITFDGTYLFVIDAATSRVFRLDPRGAVAHRFASTQIDPAAVVSDGTDAWVANRGSGTVTQYRLLDMSLLRAIPVGVQPSALLFDGTSVWVANTGSNTLTIINASTGSITATVPVRVRPVAIAFDGGAIWISHEGTNVVSKLDQVSNTIISDIPASSPGPMAFDGQDLWVYNRGDNSLQKINVAGGVESARFPMTPPALANATALVADGRRLWLTAFAGPANPTPLLRQISTANGFTFVLEDLPAGGYGAAFDGLRLWTPVGQQVRGY